MQKELDLALSPQDAADHTRIAVQVAQALGITPERISALRVLRRSVDARRRHIIVNLKAHAVFDEPGQAFEATTFSYPDVSSKDPVVVVGAGPRNKGTGL